MPTHDMAAARGEPDPAATDECMFNDELISELGADIVTRSADIDPRYFTAYNEAPGPRPRALPGARFSASAERRSLP